MGLQLSRTRELWSAMRNSYTKFLAPKDDIDKYDFEDEARRLHKEIKIAIEQVQESQFYATLREQIGSDEFQNQLKSVLGSHSQLNMVLYALGSLVYYYGPHVQLALALLLRQDCSWINEIEVYDPEFVQPDVIVLEKLGCNVLKFNERCRRKVEEPTLFYMPYPEFQLVGNLLEANWCPSQINKLIILTNRMKKASQFDEYTRAIHNYIKEIVLQNHGEEFDYNLDNFTWHFFEVNPQMDMEALFEGKFSKKSSLMRRLSQNDQMMKEPIDILAKEDLAEEKFRIPFMGGASEEEEGEEGEGMNWSSFFGNFRGPRKYRCHSDAPPEDWIKLNISGIAAHGNTPAGFGGICHDEHMNTILCYNGFLDGNYVDESKACVEALKRGLTDLMNKTDYTNLIVVGDNLKFIQCVNKRHLGQEIDGDLEEVFDLLTDINCVVYHIYEEANWKAHELARRGAMSGTDKREGFFLSWITKYWKN